MNEVMKTIRNRVSLRNYDPKEITQEHLDTILESAFLAPTAGNMMLYSIIRITDPEVKEKLSISCDNQAFIKTAPEVLIFVADWQKWQDYYHLCDVEKLCKSKEKEVHFPKEGEFFLAANDAIIAAQNTVIAAESLGIGSCYIGDIIEKFEYHQKLLNLPKYVFPVVMVTYGYYPPNAKRTHRPRFDKQFVVFENTYKKLESEDLVKMFENRQYPKTLFDNFGQFMYNRKSGTEFIHEMTRSLLAGMSSWAKDETDH